jgi:hypothetical protein
MSDEKVQSFFRREQMLRASAKATKPELNLVKRFESSRDSLPAIADLTKQNVLNCSYKQREGQ